VPNGESLSVDDALIGMTFSKAQKRDAYFFHNQEYIFASAKINNKWNNPNFLI